MRDEKREDLDWLAFCYIADELAGDEREAFERRLADDQQAREAVARAVELTCALAAVGVEPGRRSTPASCVAGRQRVRLGGPLGWAAIAASACLAVVLATQRDAGNAPTDGPGQDAAAGQRADQLAVLWSRTQEELAAWELDVWAADSADETDVLGELPTDLAADQPDEDAIASNAPPSWVLAAVESVADNSGPGEN